MKNVVAEIQLFGSVEQVELAKELADSMAQGGDFTIDALINSLRKDLRKQLKLEDVAGNVKWLRYTPKEGNSMS
ncbi:MAG: hypothetical protein WKG07_49520 [Hymenobacter sp.]